MASQERALACHRELGDRRRESMALCSLSEMHWCPGSIAASERASRESVEVLEGLEPGPELARAYVQVATLSHDADTTIEWATRARTLAEQLGEDEIALRARVEIDFTRYHHDGAPEHAAALEESRDIALASGSHLQAGQAWNCLGWGAMPPPELRRRRPLRRRRAGVLRRARSRDLRALSVHLPRTCSTRPRALGRGDRGRHGRRPRTRAFDHSAARGLRRGGGGPAEAGRAGVVGAARSRHRGGRAGRPARDALPRGCGARRGGVAGGPSRGDRRADGSDPRAGRPRGRAARSRGALPLEVARRAPR